MVAAAWGSIFLERISLRTQRDGLILVAMFFLFMIGLSLLSLRNHSTGGTRGDHDDQNWI